mgnify:CR=1 FL=1
MLFRHHASDNIAINNHQVSLMLARCNLVLNTWETCEFTPFEQASTFENNWCCTNGSNIFSSFCSLLKRGNQAWLSRRLVEPGIPPGRTNQSRNPQNCHQIRHPSQLESHVSQSLTHFQVQAYCSQILLGGKHPLGLRLRFLQILPQYYCYFVMIYLQFTYRMILLRLNYSSFRRGNKL